MARTKIKTKEIKKVLDLSKQTLFGVRDRTIGNTLFIFNQCVIKLIIQIKADKKPFYTITMSINKFAERISLQLTYSALTI